MSTIAEQPESIPDEPETGEQQLTVDERRALRNSVLSPLGLTIENRPFGHPASAERVVWFDQMTRVKVDYDPGMITGLPEYESYPHDVREVVGALDAMHKTFSDVITAREKVKKDPTLTEPAMVLAVADYADRVFPPATTKVDAAFSAITKRIEEAEAQLHSGIPGASGGTMAAEVRAHVKALSNGTERMKFMRDRIAEGDTETVAAVLKAKPFLSGLNKAEADLLTHDVNVTAQPDLLPRIRLMKKALAHLERATQPLLNDMQRAIGVRHQTVTSLRAAKAAAKIN